VDEGEMKVTVDGIEKTLFSGEGAIIFPYVTHSYNGSTDVVASCLLFDPTLTYFRNLFCEMRPENPFLTNITEYFSIFKRICELNHSKNNELTKGALGYLNGLLSELLQRINLKKNRLIENDVSKKVLEYCAQHFAEKITVKSVSEALYISQSYVSKIFSKKLCYSFREYINLLRIDKAKHLLETTDEKILDIMLDVGFDNQSSFNRVFLDLVGVSPKEYKKLHV
jgi:YesN/AraC family two-component response regulator